MLQNSGKLSSMICTGQHEKGCKRCDTIRNTLRVQKWRKNHPKQYKAAIRRESNRARIKLYGISTRQVENRVRKQGGCAICHAQTPGGVGGWNVDHDHNSKKIRGILCNSCNTGLGQFRDNVTVLIRAALYLAANI